jgi:hypothetical protein
MLSTLAGVWAAEASLFWVLGGSFQVQLLCTGADVEGQETCADWEMAWL